MKIFLGLLIIGHGLVHGILAIAPNPADPAAKPGAFFTTPERSWLLSQLGLAPPAIQWIGIILVAVATLGFVLSGLGVFGVAGLGAIWRGLAIFSSGVSLLLLVLFWHRWLPVGVLLDIGFVVALLGLKWPPVALIGA